MEKEDLFVQRNPTDAERIEDISDCDGCQLRETVDKGATPSCSAEEMMQGYWRILFLI